MDERTGEPADHGGRSHSHRLARLVRHRRSVPSRVLHVQLLLKGKGHGAILEGEEFLIDLNWK